MFQIDPTHFLIDENSLIDLGRQKNNFSMLQMDATHHLIAEDHSLDLEREENQFFDTTNRCNPPTDRTKRSD